LLVDCHALLQTYKIPSHKGHTRAENNKRNKRSMKINSNMFSKWISGVTNNLFCLTNIIICIDTWWVKVFLWIISISCNFELGQNKSYSLVRFISQESGNQLLIFLSCYNAWIFHLPPKHIFLQTTNQKHDFEIESVQRKTYSINFRFQFFPVK